MARKLHRIRTASPLCECGCGNKIAKEGNKFILGHNNKKGNKDSSSNNRPHRFQKGNKYGKGRPKNSKNKCTLAAENLFVLESGAIARQAVEMALNGHPQMIKMIMERVVSIKKSASIKLEGMPTITDVSSAGEAAQHIFNSITNGSISPLDGEILSRVLDKRLHALQITEIERELKKLKELLLE